MRNLLAYASVALFATTGPLPAAPAVEKIRVVIIDGQNNHDWRATTPHMKKVLKTAAASK